MVKILALDTSTDACSVALSLNTLSYDRFIVAPAAHTKFILPMIDELLSQAKLDYKELDAIAFGHGPGSFTGVRLAASVAQGLAFAANLPVMGISTLRALAQEVLVEEGRSQVLVAQDARMKEIYWGEYRVDSVGIMQPIVPDKLIKPEVALVGSYYGFVGVGNGFDVYKDLFSQSDLPIIAKQYVRAKYVAELAVADFASGGMVTAEKALPIYLREKVVQI